MKKTVLVTFSLLLSLNAQTLKTTLSEVIQTNPIIQERLQNYNATKQDIETARSGYYPKLDLNLGAGHENTKKSHQPNSNDQSYSFNVYQNSLKYTQNLFDGLSTSNQVDEQKFRTISAAYNYVEKVNNTSYDYAKAYLEVMKQYELLQTAKENVTINQEILDKVNKLYKSGLTTLSEVQKIESSLALAKSNLVVQENSILEKSFNLQRILGHPLEIEKMQKPNSDIKLPLTKEKVVEYALKHNPSLLVSEFNKRAAQLTSREKKSNYYPKIDLEISQSMNRNLSGIEGHNDAFRAMVYLSYNLFNGFNDKYTIKKSLNQIEQEVQNQNNVRRQILETINIAWASNEKLQEQLVDLKRYHKFSIKTLSLYQKEYSLGQRSLLDLLASQNDLIKSKEQIITTNYSILYAKYRLLDAMSVLVSSILDNNKVYSNVGLKNKGDI